jgi:hypothetical protein
MGKLNVPHTADPASNGRKGPASGSKTDAVGNETSAAMEGAFSSSVGPGSKRNVGGPGLEHNSAMLKAALP